MKSDMKTVRGSCVGLVLLSICFAAVQAAPPSELDNANAAVKTAAADKAAAKKVAAEKVAADKVAVAEKTAADLAAADKALAAAKTATQTPAAEKAAAEKALAEKDVALKAAIANAAAALANVRGGLKLLDASAWDYAKARHLSSLRSHSRKVARDTQRADPARQVRADGLPGLRELNSTLDKDFDHRVTP